jgi:hypothetical protein
VYDFIAVSCKQPAPVIQNQENANIRNIGQGEAMHKKHNLLYKAWSDKRP